MPELPPELVEGDDPPGAEWFAKLLAYLKAIRVIPSRDSGLDYASGPNGMSLAIADTKGSGFCITTSIITKQNPTTKEFGEGSATRQRVFKVAGGKAKYTPVTGPAMTLYNGSPVDEVASGRLVQYKIIDNLPFVDVDYCPATT